MSDISAQAHKAAQELIEKAGMKPGQIFVVGCSTSEVAGSRIGSAGTPALAGEILEGLRLATEQAGVFLAVQCCEHLNRALVAPAACAEKYGLTEVCVRPQPHAGGSLATVYYDSLPEPFMAESIAAHAGMDIGGTLIGMHLRAVAVPVRLSIAAIGQAPIICARTRAKLVGGARAVYPAEIR